MINFHKKSINSSVMKKAGLIVSIILLTGVITFTLLRHRPSGNVHLVKFKGVENVTNITKGYFDWLSSINYADQINAIPAQEQDILYCLPSQGEDAVLIIQHKKQSDQPLNVRFDSLGVYVDNHLGTLFWGSPAASHWLGTSTKEDLRSLQSVFIADSLSGSDIRPLEKIATFNSDIGLIIDSESGHLEELLQVLKPSWMWLSDLTIRAEAATRLNQMDHLHSLILTEVKMDQVSLDGLKNLKSLHIDSPDSVTFSQLSQWSGNLTSLHISNAEIRDLDFLPEKTQLKEITFNNCPLLKDIRALGKLPQLKTVSLANCDSIPDLTPLMELKNLRWFAPSKNINEQQLASILHSSPNLQSLVLVDCQQIKSLHQIRDSHKLSFLTLISTPLPPDSLIRFKNLKYLAYGVDHSKDSLSLARLQKEMPNTLVTAAEPFCMGTGWLIVFFGMLIALALVGVHVKHRFSA